MENRIDLIKGLLVTIMWGANFSVIETGLKELDPFALTFLRFLFCAFPLVFFITKPESGSWLWVILYGVIFGVGLWWVVNFAMYNGISAGLSSVFLQFSAFFTIILSRFCFKEKLAVVHVSGMGVSLLGLVLLMLFLNQASTLTGVFWLILAALSWAACNIIIKYARPADMLSFIVWSSLFSAPSVLLLTLFLKGSGPILAIADNITLASACSVLFQSYITTILGYMIWNNLIRKYSAAIVAPLSLLVPVSGILSSHWFLQEEMSRGQLFAVALVMLGLYLFLNANKWHNTV